MATKTLKVLPSINDHFKIATHNGEITVRNTVTGNHRTFRIRTQKDDASFAPGQRIVSLFTNGTKPWVGFGFVKDDGTIAVYRRYLGTDYEKFAKGLMNPGNWPTAEFMYAGRCRCCNIKLTNPTSITSGIGPVCGKRARS
jgi:hypothetical protein